ncbi:hypothetical protein L0Z72_12645 [candidate division KSB1 bacterium]|nr:hypothetical protein [candidate division KSB1 bacterium]
MYACQGLMFQTDAIASRDGISVLIAEFNTLSLNGARFLSALFGYLKIYGSGGTASTERDGALQTPQSILTQDDNG